jgi:hypothetical protein
MSLSFKPGSVSSHYFAQDQDFAMTGPENLGYR